jgi:hypothetical protein
MKNSFIKGDTWRFKAKEGDPGQDGEKTGSGPARLVPDRGHGRASVCVWEPRCVDLAPGFKNLRRDRPTPLGLTDLGKGNMGRRPGRSQDYRQSHLYFIAPSILEHLIQRLLAPKDERGPGSVQGRRRDRFHGPRSFGKCPNCLLRKTS